jgi:hypothetical protein
MRTLVTGVRKVLSATFAVMTVLVCTRVADAQPNDPRTRFYAETERLNFSLERFESQGKYSFNSRLVLMGKITEQTSVKVSKARFYTK